MAFVVVTVIVVVLENISIVERSRRKMGHVIYTWSETKNKHTTHKQFSINK